jgi:hypothetical protein
VRRWLETVTSWLKRVGGRLGETATEPDRDERILRWVLTLGALTVAVVHVSRPQLAIDGVTLALIGVALLPWARTFLESLELPGGFKVQYRHVQSAGQALVDAAAEVQPLGEVGPVLPERPAYLEVASSDPNLALVGLRIELEKRLRDLARRSGISDADRLSLRRLLDLLRNQGVLGQKEAAALADLIASGNNAAHGANVEPSVSAWAFEVGPSILAYLDRKLES